MYKYVIKKYIYLISITEFLCKLSRKLDNNQNWVVFKLDVH